MATTPVTGTRVTAQQLLALPGDGRRELIQGELREMAPAGGHHGRVAIRIGRLLDQYAEEHGGHAFAAETGFLLAADPDTVRAPDAAYVDEEHARRVGSPAGYWPGAPDVAVEVVSPNDAYSELHEKALGWLAAGSRVVLVADPAAGHVTRYRSPSDVAVFAGDEEVGCEAAMPGFAPTASALLAERR